MNATGQSELFNFGTRIGLWFNFWGWWVVSALASGIGYANSDVLNRDMIFSFGTIVSSESIFTYDFLFSLGYEIKKDLDVFFAYRVLAMNGKGDFDEATMHLLELGLGANF